MSMTEADQRKLLRFEMDEAKFVHEDVIRPRLWKWVDGIIVEVVERRRFGSLGRFFHFLVEYFYIRTFLGIRIRRNKHTSLLSGKGYSPGRSRTRLDRIRSTVLKRGQEVAHKDFPINIIF